MMIGHRNPKTSLLLLILIAALSSCAKNKAPPAPDFEGYSDEPEFTTEPGEEKTITFSWSASTGAEDNSGRKRVKVTPDFSICVTSNSDGIGSASNKCYDLVNVSCTIRAANTLFETRDCTGQLVLPSELHGVQNYWYVRAEDPDDEKLYSNSNTRPFAWNIALANLQITSDNDPDIVGFALLYEVEITNTGDAPASNAVVRCVVELNAADGALPQQTVEAVSQMTLLGTNQGQSPNTDLVACQVSIMGLARPLECLFAATVDPDNAVAESNEGDNTYPPRQCTIF